jgi:hypothetical protein
MVHWLGVGEWKKIIFFFAFWVNRPQIKRIKKKGLNLPRQSKRIRRSKKVQLHHLIERLIHRQLKKHLSFKAKKKKLGSLVFLFVQTEFQPQRKSRYFIATELYPKTHQSVGNGAQIEAPFASLIWINLHLD